MVAGPVTGAEGDEQTGGDVPDLRVWPEFGIPAQRAEESSTEPKAQPSAAAGFGAVPLAPPIVEPAPGIEEFEPAPDAQTQPDAAPRTLRSIRSHRSRMRRQTSNGVIVLACLAVIFLVLHRFLPDAGGVGSLLETWLPWTGLPILLLFVIAAIVHTKRAIVVTLAAALVWTALYGPTMLPRGSSATAQLRIFSEDVNGNAQEATASGTMALAQHADIVALEDMYPSVSESNAVNALNNAFTNHTAEYEFGLWSAYQIVSAQPIALGTTQTAQSLSLDAQAAGLAASASGAPIIGALKATLKTPEGALTVYLVHLPQPVLGDQGFAKARDQALTKFAQLVEADNSPRIAVVGDVNVAATDRQFSQLAGADALTSAQQAVGSGFGFTWPAEFPVVRLDDVLTRGLKPLRSVVLPAIAKGQTHLPIQVDLDY
jgi:vancomycin resistance protein VanJ